VYDKQHKDIATGFHHPYKTTEINMYDIQHKDIACFCPTHKATGICPTHKATGIRPTHKATGFLHTRKTTEVNMYDKQYKDIASFTLYLLGMEEFLSVCLRSV
jgi:hypothetical protein